MPPFRAYGLWELPGSVRPPRRQPLRRSCRTGDDPGVGGSPLSAAGWDLWVSGRWLKLYRVAGDDARGGSSRSRNRVPGSPLGAL